jgi:outer membrane protein assembly factor BamB
MNSVRIPRMIAFALVVWASLGVFASVGSAQNVRWEASPVPGTAVALVRHHLLVGGSTLAAYHTGSGEKEWERSSSSPSEIGALVVNRGRVFAGGTIAGPFPSHELFVAAFDPTTGEQLWADTVEHSPRAVFVDAIVAGRGRVFVVGTTIDFDLLAASAFIRAYNAETGARLWDDSVDLTAQTIDYLTAAEVEGQLYLVAGRTGGLAPEGASFVIRAYNPRTGRLVWQDTSPGGQHDGATVVAGDRARVFTGGTRIGQRGLLVRAYDRHDGHVIWQDAFFGGDLNFVTGMALHRGRLIVSGFGGGVLNSGSFVKAYDAQTGAVLWEETPTGGGQELSNRSLAVARNSVFVAGSRQVEFSSRFSVRALDLETGQLQWEDLREGAGPAVAIEAGNGVVAVVGQLDGTLAPFVRAYDQ